VSSIDEERLAFREQSANGAPGERVKVLAVGSNLKPIAQRNLTKARQYSAFSRQGGVRLNPVYQAVHCADQRKATVRSTA
jgi:hypothetical protein